MNTDQNDALADPWKKVGRIAQIAEPAVNINNRQSGVIAGLTAAVNALAQAQGAKDVGKAIRDAVEAAAPTY